MSKKRNTQIPEEAIQGAATIKDKTEIYASSTEIMCNNDVIKPNKNNSKTESTNSVSRPILLSTELAEGMSIKTENTPSAEQGRE